MIRDTARLPATQPTATDRAAPRAAPGAVEPPGMVAPGVPMLNPRLRIETELNLIVLEFRDDAGEVRQSIPSPQEIDAYRAALREEPEEPPAALDVTR